jgi:hypothetical protein
MNLQELNNFIHKSNKDDFINNRSSWVATITNLLNNASESDIEYFRNHTGRELIRKAHLFDDISFIEDAFDDGFRPKRVDPTAGLAGNIISWYDASDSSSHDLDSQNRILKAYDKAGSFDLSTNQGINRTPTIDPLEFDDGRFRNAFFFNRGAGHDNCMFRSYDFSHNFNLGKELNMLLVLHHMASNPGDADSQDFIFEAAQNGQHDTGSPRLFLRKGGEDGSNGSFNSSGLGGAINFNETEAGFQLDNPVNLLLNIHLKQGSQALRVNGTELKTSTKASLVNITNELIDDSGNAGGGIHWGSNIYGGQTLEGGFGEIILYDDFAEDGEFLESYLAKKWGFDIPTPKHFKTFV